jgi:hypothetical protein
MQSRTIAGQRRLRADFWLLTEGGGPLTDSKIVNLLDWRPTLPANQRVTVPADQRLPHRLGAPGTVKIRFALGLLRLNHAHPIYTFSPVFAAAARIR